MEWVNLSLLMFIFGVIFWELRNIKNNHLKSIYERLRNLEIKSAEMNTLIKEVIKKWQP